MKIYEAYDDTKIRLRFKDFIEAEGLSMSKREQVYTRFGTYMSRIRGVGYDRKLIVIRDEDSFRETLEWIFFDKWKDHLGYPEMPHYFFRYLDFLHTLSAIQPEIEIEGLSQQENLPVSNGKLTRYEEQFVSAEGKLRLLANPQLIKQLRDNGMWSDPVSDEALSHCRDFYAGTVISMSDDEWRELIKHQLPTSKRNKKRGDISFEILTPEGNTRILNAAQTMEYIVSLAGAEKVTNCKLKLQGQPLVVKKVPQGRQASFKQLDDNLFINISGSVMDKFKVFRVLISLCRLPMTIALSKEASVKSAPRRRKTKTEPKPEKNPNQSVVQPDTPASTVSQPVDAKEPYTPLIAEDDNILYGNDGTLNLFD